jgi:hypothetical protein
MGYTSDVLDEVRADIAADDGVLVEARTRRNLVVKLAESYPGVARTFTSGSVTHRTVNDPVSDADAGIVLDRRYYPELGPDGDGEIPNDIVDDIDEFVGEPLRDVYLDATCGQSKRGLYFRFNEPMLVNGEEQDPTVDVVIALNRIGRNGLWIPNLKTSCWQASDPEHHNELFGEGTAAPARTRRRVTRLMKAWNAQFSERGLVSFNIEVLVWEYLESGMGVAHGLAGLFDYAATQFDEVGQTQDPAGVSGTIKLKKPKDVVVKRLRKAADVLAAALEVDNDKDAVREQLSQPGVFWKFVNPPASSTSAAAYGKALNNGNAGVSVGPGLLLGTSGSTFKTTRSYGEG